MQEQVQTYNAHVLMVRLDVTGFYSVGSCRNDARWVSDGVKFGHLGPCWRRGVEGQGGCRAGWEQMAREGPHWPRIGP